MTGMEPAGTPAVPMPASTQMNITTTWSGRDSCTPKSCARKSTVTPSKSAVPFWFIARAGGEHEAASRCAAA